jgi:hemerythrin
MTALTWSETLALKQPRMDQTHREFVELLQGLAAAAARGPAAVDDVLAALIQHTEAHFDQEDRWMSALGFAPVNCHSAQHAQVLSVLREVQQGRAWPSDPALMPTLVDELGRWFVAHAQTVDAALAQRMIECGYDPDCGHLMQPPAASLEPITGCGSTRCR